MTSPFDTTNVRQSALVRSQCIRALPPLLLAVLLGSLPQTVLSRAYDHDNGFFLRLSAGIGGAATEMEDVTPRPKFSGACSDVNFAIGGMVSKNLALHATLLGWAMTDPEFELGSASATTNGDLSLSGLGVGLTYYVMPVNLYFSGSVGAGTLQLDLPSQTYETDTGVILDFTIGKEWWVSRSWGLGIAGGLGVHSIPEDRGNVDWTGASATLRFTATYNN